MECVEVDAGDGSKAAPEGKLLSTTTMLGGWNDTFFVFDGLSDRLDGGPGIDLACPDRADRVVSVERRCQP